MHGTRLVVFVLALGIDVVMPVVSMSVLDPDPGTWVVRTVGVVPALLMRRDGLRVRPWGPERPRDPALGERAQDCRFASALHSVCTVPVV